MMEAKTTKRRVIIRWFDYIDVDGEKCHGRRGDIIEVSTDDLARGLGMNAFYPEDQTEVTDEAEELLHDDDEVEIHAMSVDELAEWIESDRPTVKELMVLCGGEVTIAKKILKAENAATGNDPRPSLFKGLTAVIQRSAE